MFGGGGEVKTLKLVAQHANYCNLFPSPDLTHKLNILKEHCKTQGRDYNEIGKNLFLFGGIFVSESKTEINDYLEKTAKKYNLTVDELNQRITKDFPGKRIGLPEEVIEYIEHFISLGFDYFQLMFPGINEEYLQASEAFANLVLKKF